MAVTSTLTFKIKTVLTKVTGLGAPADTMDKDLSDTLTDGTEKDRCDIVWSDTRALSANSSETLDLNATLIDALGTTVNALKVVAIVFHNKETTAGLNLQIGAGSTTFNLFGSLSSRYNLGPDGIYFIWEPSLAAKSVTAGSADLLQVRNGNASVVNYEVAILARTA